MSTRLTIEQKKSRLMRSAAYWLRLNATGIKAAFFKDGKWEMPEAKREFLRIHELIKNLGKYSKP